MIYLLKFYKGTTSFLLEVLFGKGCRFSPTCSEYFTQAVNKHGFLRGTELGLKRIARCHPFTNPAFDPVPNKQ